MWCPELNIVSIYGEICLWDEPVLLKNKHTSYYLQINMQKKYLLLALVYHVC